MKFLDLFSGIGSFALGLERAGHECVAFCEIDKYCQAVLRKHWPNVPIYDDVTTLTAARLAADGIRARLICGGFPCQDISVAGKGAGIEGSRSGLWSEYARIIGEVRPQYAIVENVAALLGRGLGVVLRDLAALGYDAEWHCIPASAVGAPHRRDRLWLVAYPQADASCADTNSIGSHRAGQHLNGETEFRNEQISQFRPLGKDVADTGEPGLSPSECEIIFGAGRWDEGRTASECGWWSTEPNVGRVAHGVPHRVDRLRALGNAVVPQIPEIIGRAIGANG